MLSNSSALVICLHGSMTWCQSFQALKIFWFECNNFMPWFFNCEMHGSTFGRIMEINNGINESHCLIVNQLNCNCIAVKNHEGSEILLYL